MISIGKASGWKRRNPISHTLKHLEAQIYKTETQKGNKNGGKVGLTDMVVHYVLTTFSKYFNRYNA